MVPAVGASNRVLFLTIKPLTYAYQQTTWFDNLKVVIKSPTRTETVAVADIITLTDYYPFGMAMPGRTLSNSEHYRYGFNGMEKDDDWYGENDAYDFGARMYDGRTGRWQSRDPLAEKYPYLSPYVGMGNRPTVFVDRDGRDTWFYTKDGTFLGKVEDNLPNAVTILTETIPGVVGNMLLMTSVKGKNTMTDADIRLIRSLNISYNLDALLAFNDYAEANEVKDYGNVEHGTFLGYVDGLIAPIGKPITGDISKIYDSQWDAEMREIFIKIYAMAHTHPGTKQGPSPTDVFSISGDGETGHPNIVIDDEYLYFYHNGRTKTAEFTKFYGNNKDWMGSGISLIDKYTTGAVKKIVHQQYVFRIEISEVKSSQSKLKESSSKTKTVKPKTGSPQDSKAKVKVSSK